MTKKSNPIDEQRRRKERKYGRREQKEFLVAIERAETFIGQAIYSQSFTGRQVAIQSSIDALRAAALLAKTSSHTYNWYFKKTKGEK